VSRSSAYKKLRLAVTDANCPGNRSLTQQNWKKHSKSESEKPQGGRGRSHRSGQIATAVIVPGLIDRAPYRVHFLFSIIRNIPAPLKRRRQLTPVLPFRESGESEWWFANS
jgi:hypothetical protein